MNEIICKRNGKVTKTYNSSLICGIAVGGCTMQQDLFRLDDDGDVCINFNYLKNRCEIYVVATYSGQLNIVDEKRISKA